MRCMPPYYQKFNNHNLNNNNLKKNNKKSKRGSYRASANIRRPRAVRAFNDNQGYQSGQNNTGNNNSNNNTNTTNSSCPSAVEYIGNVFLLGLTTLVGELVDLQAANALNVLLQPFQWENDGGVQQEILAGDVQDNDIIDLLDGLL